MHYEVCRVTGLRRLRQEDGMPWNWFQSWWVFPVTPWQRFVDWAGRNFARTGLARQLADWIQGYQAMPPPAVRDHLLAHERLAAMSPDVESVPVDVTFDPFEDE